MEETRQFAMTPPKPGSRRARRAAERAAAAAAAAARSVATTGEIPAIVEANYQQWGNRPVRLQPTTPFAEQMNHELVVSRLGDDVYEPKTRKSFMMQSVGFGSAAAFVVGIGLGIAVENVPQNFAMATNEPSLSELATASVALDGKTPIIEGVTSKFSLTVDGKERTLASNARVTLADALNAAGITVNSGDIVSHQLNKPIADGEHVTITRVTTETATETYVVEPETQREDDETLAKGEEKKVSDGKPGEGTRTVTVTKHDGTEVKRVTTVDAITTPAEPIIIKVGTKEGASSSASANNVPVNAAPVAPGTARAIAADLVAGRGWSEAEFACLDQLWQRESGWNHLANNPSSGAYGIPQALPGSKMASAGADWQTNPATQITWGLGYISGRYGTPCGALSHSHSVGWY
ncbi:G5 domain-containing protein [Arcanobacterium buesumense]|uniref:DUF348 domain-containing protein n=1 Tax=Arcanobacterium buesumense TaxID=2722751 RepID=A0A6H2EMX5_9ACTO|nr:G5 domain-containing protein [Arcanobacterium buesumense]QJC22421.1 DUF348 domain-containing protein [Arcanobacterium buesumense]